MSKSKSLLIFDCDGVLVDSEIVACRVLAALLSRHGYPITASESLAKFTGMTIPGVIEMVAEEGVELPEDFEAQLRERDVEAFASELKAPPGMQTTLEQLAGRPKCVATNGSPDKTRVKLELTGLIRHFEPFVFSATEVKKPKPAPDLFLMAANRMGFAPSDCVVIEDSVLGVEGGKRAGMRVLGFIGAGHRSSSDADVLRRAGADLVFADIEELPRLV
jgi:HAD superfamily hydrolase (TIGR01509 family)